MSKNSFFDFGSNNNDMSALDFSSLAPEHITHLQAQNGINLELTTNKSLSSGQYTQHGNDLEITWDSGEQIHIHDYFSALETPSLVTQDGKSFSPELINSFLSNKSLRYAESDDVLSDAPSINAIGQITESSGDVTIIRTNGQTVKGENGTLIYQGDIIETAESGAANIIFADESSFAISNDARLTIDEFVFDPTGLDGLSNFSMLQGAFVYTSGTIGSADPDDVRITTPIGSIGIRGTVIAGNLPLNGPAQITVVEGAIVVRNNAGEQVLSKQFDTVQIQGNDEPIINIGPISANDVAKSVQGIQGVAGGFFNTLQQSQNGESNDSAAPEGRPADARTKGEQQQNKGNGSPENTAPAENNGEQLKSGEAKPAGTETEKNITIINRSNDLNERGEGELGENNLQQPTGERVPAPDTATTSPGGSTGTTAPPPPSAGSDPLPTNPDVITPPNTGGTAPGSGLPQRLNLNTPNDASNLKTVSGFPLGEQYGTTVTTVYNAVNGFNDVVFVRGDFGATSTGNYVVLTGAATLTDNIDLSGQTFEDISDNAPNTQREQASSITSGDFDGDGSHEILIGTPRGSNALSSNEDDGFVYSVDLGGNPVTPSYTNYGSAVATDTNQQLFAQSIANVGDINNDGKEDIAIGAPGAFSTLGVVRLELLGSDLGSIITTIDYQGGAAQDLLGGSVTGLGDINGDGYDDFAFGVFDGFINGSNLNSITDSFFIVRGGSNPLFYDEFSEILEVTGGTGYGRNVTGVGDVNGDGFDDLVVNDGPARAKLLFGYNSIGSGTSSDTSFSQMTLDVSAQGYVIEGGGAAGDFNADGEADFIIMMRNGADVKLAIIMGNDSLVGLNADLQYLEDHPEIAYMIDYNLGTAPSGHYDMEFSYGDLNGDGFDDIIITDPENDQAFIVEGGEIGNPFSSYRSGNNIGATADYQILTATALNDTLRQNGSLGGVYKGGAGLDTFIIDDAMNGAVPRFEQIDGGGGDNDRVILDGGQGTLDFTDLTRNHIQRIEAIEVGAGNNLTINVQQIFNLLKSSDNGELKITALGAGSTLNIESTGNHTDDFNGIGDSLENLTPVGGIAPVGAAGYQRYDIGDYQLFIDNDFGIITTQHI